MLSMLKIRLSVYLFTLIMILSVSSLWGSVYQLTNSLRNDASSKLIIDKNGDVWCFWIEYENNSVQGKSRLLAKYFHNGEWSEQISIFDSSAFQYVFDYDIDVDYEQNIWVSFTNSTYLCLLKQEEDKTFKLKGVYYEGNSYTSKISNSLVMAVSDSDQVFIHAFFLDDAEGLKLLHFHNSQFNIIDSTQSAILMHCQEWPVNTFKARRDKIYIVTNEYSEWDWNQYYNGIIYPVSVYPEFHSPEYSQGIGISYWSETGIDNRGNLYVFNKSDPDLKAECRLKLLDTVTDTVRKNWGKINFIPDAVSKHGGFLAAAWEQDNTIFLKGIKDSTIYKTVQLPEDSIPLIGEIEICSVQPDTFPKAWITWKSKISNQYEIFAADCMLSNEIDTNAVLALRDEAVKISRFKLMQNYPNPFNPVTEIKYTLPKFCRVNLSVYNLLGQRVKTLINEFQPAGTYTAVLDGSRLPSGIYIYRIQTNAGFVKSKKCILIK